MRSWDPKAHEYKIYRYGMRGLRTPLEKLSFVVRVRTGKLPAPRFQPRPYSEAEKESNMKKCYIDLTSEGLRDIVKSVLRDVRHVWLGGEKPSVNYAVA